MGNIALRKSRERAILVKIALETYLGGHDKKELEKAKEFAKKEAVLNMPMAEDYKNLVELLETEKISRAVILIREIYFKIKGGAI